MEYIYIHNKFTNNNDFPYIPNFLYLIIFSKLNMHV